MNPIVTTRAGDVRGALVDGCFSFLGIPYAAEPTGALRFAGPEPHAAWQGVRDALVYGATAAQPAQDFTLIPEPAMPGDNCLNLNVFTPELGSAELPVLVWIHGGGFMSGCSASPWYRGEAFNRDGVVVVSLNYRLGVEGFGIVTGSPANRGVLDWVAALTWVRDNIASFGGDPGSVTIAGQSAGAGACVALMAVPRAKGLFHRVIAMSGSGHLVGTLASAEDATRKVADLLGIKTTREDFAATNIERLLEAQSTAAPMMGPGGPVDQRELAKNFASQPLLFAPVPDGDILPVHPVQAMAAGAGSEIPLLIGATAGEFAMLARMGSPVDESGTIGALALLGLEGPVAVEYAAAHGTDTIGQAITDRMFRIPARRTAESRRQAAGGTYVYDFGWESTAMGGMFGAGHCMDVPFAFDNLHAEGTEVALGEDPPQALADTVHQAWVSFITSGDPGWPAYGADRTTMVFGETSAPTPDALAPLLSAWANLP